MRSLQAEATLPEDKFCLDPEIIDLTFFPPPATPDSEAGPLQRELGSGLSVPPTPFADQSPPQLDPEVEVRISTYISDSSLIMTSFFQVLEDSDKTT